MTTYTLTHFQTLIQSYPTWPQLEAFLSSPEGGSFRCSGDGRWRVIRYVRQTTELKQPWMRAVIWDTQEHLPVCLAPPKAERGDPTGETMKFPLSQTFLDGVMINAFRTLANPSEITFTTRSQIGAGGKFYSEKTFEQMTEDALSSMGYTRKDLLRFLAEPTEMVPHHFVSFVLQHPEHRVVARCRVPHLWVVHTGAVHDNGLVSMNESPDHWPSRFQIPAVYPSSSLSDFFTEQCTEKGWFFQGIVLKDGTGKRWRMRNPTYQYLRSLRGSEASALDRFLRLRAEKKISEYLKHYSEDRERFWDLEQKFRDATDQVYQGYCDVHKSRAKTLKDLPWSIQPCVFKLHSLYLEQLRPSNGKILKNHAVDLVNSLALFEQKRLLSSAERPARGLVAAAAALSQAALA
jgi:hypothetical protein